MNTLNTGIAILLLKIMIAKITNLITRLAKIADVSTFGEYGLVR